MKFSTKEWAKLPCGNMANLYTLNNGKIEFTVSNLGGIITSIKTPDKNGVMGEVCLGYDTAEEYLSDKAYVGAMVGRYANRIKAGKLPLNGVTHQLDLNEGGNHLHGGGVWNKKLWDVASADENGVVLEYFSPNGECGYPGNLKVKVKLSLRDSSLRMDFYAKSDADTYVSLTNHAYFNLKNEGDILSHKIQINASKYTPITADDLMPTGEILPVAGTKLDYLSLKEIKHDDVDNNFVPDSAGTAAVVKCDTTGRTMEVSTDLPCIQFYVGVMLSEHKGRGGAAYGKNSGLCLEPQFFPNGPNEEGFADGLLLAGQEYKKEIVLTFS